MKSSEVKIFSCILVIALLLAGVAMIPAILQMIDEGKKPGPVKEPNLNRATLVPPGTPTRGDANAPITIVAFSDFQCSSCATGAPLVKKLLGSMKGQVNEVFHHFQARPDHVYASTLSRATECAGEQGKFWEMHDQLFASQKELVESRNEDHVIMQIRRHANKLGLDMMKFDVAMRGMVGTERFKKDNNLGVAIKVESTPTYFVIDAQDKVEKYEGNVALGEWAKRVAASKGP